MSDLFKGVTGIVLWFFLAFGMMKTGCAPCCEHIPLCGHDHTTAVIPPVNVTEVSRYPLDFQWSDATGFTNEGYAELKSDILSGAGDNNKLEIVGNYYEGEDNTSDFEDLGLARANQVKELLLADIPEDRIQISSQKLGAPDKALEGYFESANFNWLEGERGPVEILADRAIIRFPYNSVQKEVDPKIDAYLSQLAIELRETGGTVHLTGHTDDRGSEERNETLAHRRAKMIRDILRDKRVRRSQIKTFTKGETEPISTNDTDEGRRDNRRVEVRKVDF